MRTLFILSLILNSIGINFTDTSQKTSYVVVWGEFGLTPYNGKVKHLCISEIKRRECPESIYETPGFLNAFNEVVYGIYPEAKNVYMSGYKSYFKCFDNEDDAASFRQKTINNAIKVDAIRW